MMSYSMYTIETVDDARIAAETGLLDLVIDGSRCENCGMVIGPSQDEFFPLVVICHDAEDEAWPVCIECSSPIIFPDEGPITMEFDFDPDMF